MTVECAAIRHCDIAMAGHRRSYLSATALAFPG